MKNHKNLNNVLQIQSKKFTHGRDDHGRGGDGREDDSLGTPFSTLILLNFWGFEQVLSFEVWTRTEEWEDSVLR